MNIQQHKTTVFLEPIHEIVKYQVADIQRLLNMEHVESLVTDQLDEYHDNGELSALQSITCADLDGKRYILDGQHRIEMFKKLNTVHKIPLTQFVPVVC